MPRKTTILIVDDEEIIRETLSDWLKKESYRIETAVTGEEAMEKIAKTRVDIAIVDIKLPGMDGIEVLRELKEMNLEIPVIMITAYATISTAVESMKQGAYDYFAKPFNLEEVSLVIKKIAERQKLIAENITLREQLRERYSFENIVGRSIKMRRIFELIEDIADSEATILIQGESGTGKEIIARAIHQRSRRRDKPFITVNCAAIPETLLESELFGYEKGAFTGAVTTRKGRFEMADGGTLFLDEVTEMSPNAQIDLLRVLQEKEFRRVGGSKLIKIDTRIIASSNKNVEETVKQGKFREDLYYRLNVVPIYLPLLRERKEDIPLLIHHFLKKYKKESKKEIKGITKEAMNFLTKYAWPGNIRELENVILRAMVLSKKEHIMSEDLPEKIVRVEGRDKKIWYPPDKSLEEMEREHIANVLKSTGWNLSQSAKTLKINRMTLYNKIKKYRITK